MHMDIKGQQKEQVSDDLQQLYSLDDFFAMEESVLKDKRFFNISKESENRQYFEFKRQVLSRNEEVTTIL
jgi:hypothetical protein